MATIITEVSKLHQRSVRRWEACAGPRGVDNARDHSQEARAPISVGDRQRRLEDKPSQDNGSGRRPRNLAGKE